MRSRNTKRLAVVLALVGAILGGAAAAGAAQNTTSARGKAPAPTTIAPTTTTSTTTTSTTVKPPTPSSPPTPTPVQPVAPPKEVSETPTDDSVNVVDAGTVGDEVNPEQPVVDNPAGFTVTTLEGASYDSQFNQLTDDAARLSAAAPTVPKTGKVVSVTSLAGLKNAGLPQWVQIETLNELGHASWADVPANKMNDKIAQVAFNFDAMALNTFVEANPAPGTVQDRGICDVFWDAKSKGGSKQVDKKDNLFNINKPDTPSWWSVHASVTGYIKGDVTYAINYSLKKRKCIGIPYGARLDTATLDASLVIGAQALLEANANKKWQTDFHHKFVPFVYGYKADLGPFVFDLSASADITLGVKLQAEIDAHLKARVNLEGAAHYGWSCTSTSCAQTAASHSLHTTVSDDTEASVNINFAVIPYVEVGVQVGVALVVPIVRGRVAIAGAMPARLHFAACLADLDGNLSFEGSLGAFVDVSLELYAYYAWQLFNANGFGSINLPIGNWKKITVPANADTMYASYPGDGEMPADSGASITKTIKVFFNRPLFAGSNDVLRPIVRQTKAGIKIRPQHCYPFDGTPNYEIDLGNGTPFVTAPAGVYPKIFNGPGVAKVRIVGDNMGRTLTSDWVTINVIKSSDVIDAPDQVDTGSDTSTTKQLNISASSTAKRENNPPNSASATATVTVKDKAGVAVPNATVKGNWSGVWQGNNVATTDANGVATLTSYVGMTPATMKFTVTSVEAAGYGAITGTTSTSVKAGDGSGNTWWGTPGAGVWQSIVEAVPTSVTFSAAAKAEMANRITARMAATSASFGPCISEQISVGLAWITVLGLAGTTVALFIAPDPTMVTKAAAAGTTEALILAGAALIAAYVSLYNCYDGEVKELEQQQSNAAQQAEIESLKTQMRQLLNERSVVQDTVKAFQ
jgi:hypothetical protein